MKNVGYRYRELSRELEPAIFCHVSATKNVFDSVIPTVLFPGLFQNVADSCQRKVPNSLDISNSL